MKGMILGLALAVLVSSSCFADTLVLKDGRIFDGVFKSRGDGVVTFDASGLLLTVPEPDIKDLTFGPGGGSRLQPASQTAMPAQPVPQPTGGVIVPAGTILHVRTRDAIDTRNHTAGHRFTAVMEADIVVGGVVTIPRGAAVYGQLIDAKQAGHVVGKSSVTLVFTGVMFHNQIMPLYSGQIEARSESGSGGSTLRRTATGAIIGGVLDGTSGAKTGAGIGLGLSLLLRGNSLIIPSGTLLDVSLASPFGP